MFGLAKVVEDRDGASEWNRRYLYLGIDYA